MYQATVDLLRHFEVHGARTHEEVKKAFADRRAGEVAQTLYNLAYLGYLAPDGTTKPITYTLTGKARKKLANPDATTTVRRARASLQPRRNPDMLRASTPAAAAKPFRPSVNHYQGAELTSSARPGSMDALAHPSRFGNTLHFRDGRITDLAGNPIPTSQGAPA